MREPEHARSGVAEGNESGVRGRVRRVCEVRELGTAHE